MSFRSTQTRTSCLLHALFMAMVLSYGVLLEPIYIHPLDETTSSLSMSYKGTRCENSHWPTMTDRWCSICYLQGSTSRAWNVDLVAARLLSLLVAPLISSTSNTSQELTKTP